VENTLGTQFAHHKIDNPHHHLRESCPVPRVLSHGFFTQTTTLHDSRQSFETCASFMRALLDLQFKEKGVGPFKHRGPECRIARLVCCVVRSLVDLEEQGHKVILERVDAIDSGSPG
jgi:hypothetical protein